MPEEDHGNAISIVIRWLKDEKYRNSQQAHGWTENDCRYLDYLTTLDISNTAPWYQRYWYESTITLVCNDEDRQGGPMNARKDSNPVRNISQVFDKNKDDTIPVSRRTRERGKDHSMKHCEHNLNG